MPKGLELLLGELKGTVDQIDKRTERIETRLDKYIIKVSAMAGAISVIISLVMTYWKG